MTQKLIKAPPLQVAQWFNTVDDIHLSQLLGKVVVIEAFQMLCPGCVSHGLPLAQSIYNTFPAEEVAVLGLHTVFEHHTAMTPVSLKAFLFEYKLSFPVAVDQPAKSNIPKTMQAYGLRGTPSLILIDKLGNLRADHFGQVSDLRIGAEIATLIAESEPLKTEAVLTDSSGTVCDDNGCNI